MFAFEEAHLEDVSLHFLVRPETSQALALCTLNRIIPPKKMVTLGPKVGPLGNVSGQIAVFNYNFKFFFNRIILRPAARYRRVSVSFPFQCAATVQLCVCVCVCLLHYFAVCWLDAAPSGEGQARQSTMRQQRIKSVKLCLRRCVNGSSWPSRARHMWPSPASVH